jgi:ribosomal protein S10
MQIILKAYSFHSFFLTQLTKQIKQKSPLFQYAWSGPVYLPTKSSKLTVARSPHVNKKSREQFVCSVHKRLFLLKFSNYVTKQLSYLKFFIQYIKTLCVYTQLKVIYINKN